MTAILLQRHVAIVLAHSTRPCGTPNFAYLTCTRIQLESSRKWQSTATKTISVPNDVEPSVNKYEIPSDCYVDSSSFPEPCLSRSRASVDYDLSTTRPATLNSPSAPERRDYPDGEVPLSDRAKYSFRLGKSYLLFYKTGLKNVWTNSKHLRSIKSKFLGHSLNTVARYGGTTFGDKQIPEISRSEYQMYLRTRHDVFKMIPFSLVFLICGEFTPLVIVALGSSVVPYTCIIPRQENGDVEKKLQKDKHYMEDLPLLKPDLETPLKERDWRIEHLEAYRLGLTMFRTPIPLLGPIYHALLTRPRLVRHCNNLVSDTILIRRQGGVFKLSSQDLYEWADTYGLYALRQYVEKCRNEGENPVSEKLKSELLPKVDAEMDYMLNKVADWSRLKPAEQWRVALRTVGSKSPDWKARVDAMRQHWKQA